MQRDTFFADVIVPLSVPRRYTYRVPIELNDAVTRGKRVLVQFGKSKVYTGIIYAIHQKAPTDYTAKYLDAVLDDEAIVNDIQLRFWDWMAYYYCANPGEVMNAALPAGLKLSSTSHVQLNPEFNFEESAHDFFTEREHQILDALHAHANLDFDALADMLKIKSTHPLIHKLLKKNAVLIYEDVKERYKPKLQHMLRLNEAYTDTQTLQSLLQDLEKRAFKQAEVVLKYLHLQRTENKGKKEGENNRPWVKLSELGQGSELSPIKALIKKKVFEDKHIEVGRLLFESATQSQKELSLKQQAVIAEIKTAFTENKTVLFQGVTGSGKTEVYIHLIQEALDRNEQILYLLPEIALTTQLITRLRAVFGELVGVYHSRFSENERVEVWNKVLSFASAHDAPSTHPRQCRIILGARSAVMLPFQKLGLVIVDEEHDASFKQQDPAPRYQARDAALYLASLHKAKVLLGSATPSVESYFLSEQGKYQLVKLQTQFEESGGTEAQVCDLKYFQQTQQMRAILSRPLFEGIEKALAKKQQVILFQNRRGFAPYTECRDCAHVPKCVQCDVSLIYHKQQDKLVCHYCGYTIPPPKVCPACGSSNLQYKGLGTEKIEEDVEVLFPKAKIARMDLDSTRSKYAYKQIIDDFESGQVDILIGTQMVTKGLDFKNVQVVGVLNADSILNFPDFRSFERAFQLITQVKGRAGRGKEKGIVYIQTTHPEHKVLDFVKANNYAQFFKDAIKDRELHFYPPFSRLFEITVISSDVNEVNHLANELFKLLNLEFKNHLLGPEFPLVAKIKNRYHKRVLLKVGREEKGKTVRQAIYNCLESLQFKHKTWKYRVAIDVDPQ
jgi:primosomal protein N' (replication factor Y) (superfamily II helicase)